MVASDNIHGSEEKHPGSTPVSPSSRRSPSERGSGRCFGDWHSGSAPELPVTATRKNKTHPKPTQTKPLTRNPTRLEHPFPPPRVLLSHFRRTPCPNPNPPTRSAKRASPPTRPTRNSVPAPH